MNINTSLFDPDIVCLYNVYNLVSIPKNTIFKKGCWWAKSGKGYARCKYHGKCEYCGRTIWRTAKIKRSFRFCSTKCKSAVLQKGKRSNNWRGGRKINIHGYAEIYRPDHPNATAGGYIKEHRYIMSLALGRALLPNEIVHHINEDRLDNHISNLQIVSLAEHFSMHNTGREFTEDHKKKISERNILNPVTRDLKTGRFIGDKKCN